ncbi:MAG: hypothetical protein IPG34_04520 [Rhodocyclaceae bacterium]|nr:hypothetical protein [Rhodocyclaceae bacterium]
MLQRVALDLIDDYDEELELELEDRTDRDYLEGASAISSEDQKRYRREYFTNLFHLQSELVKLQDWIAQRPENHSFPCGGVFLGGFFFFFFFFFCGWVRVFFFGLGFWLFGFGVWVCGVGVGGGGWGLGVGVGVGVGGGGFLPSARWSSSLKGATQPAKAA